MIFINNKELLLEYGGHHMAGGFCVDENHYEEFYQCVDNALKDLSLESTLQAIEIDSEDLSVENIESLVLLEPLVWLMKNLYFL